MGWLFYPSYGSPKGVVEHMEKQCRDVGWKVLKHAFTCYGRRAWIALEKDGKSFILLLMIDKHDGWWGYKDIEESAGPYQHDCPLSLLDMTTGDDHEYAVKWREGVRLYHETRRKRQEASKAVKVGDKVTVYGKAYQIIEKIKRSFVGIQEATGRRYRITSLQIGT